MIPLKLLSIIKIESNKTTKRYKERYWRLGTPGQADWISDWIGLDLVSYDPGDLNYALPTISYYNRAARC